ncbi:MAG: Flagellar biosynthesis protein FliO [Verrucomicrobiota bacterium]
MNRPCAKLAATVLSGLLSAASVGAADTNSLTPAAGPIPGVGFSLARVFGGLILVLALFLAGVWLFKHWQRLTIARGRSPRLNLLEIKALGNRHALYVVAYEQQRLLIASSPAGVTLLTHLPDGEAGEIPAPAAPASFARALQQVLAAKS